MATHLDALHEAERAVVEAAILWRDEFGGRRECELFNVAVDALLALRAATCPTCGGTGEVEAYRGSGFGGTETFDPAKVVATPCKCDNGKRRTT